MLVLKDPVGADSRRAERSAHLRSCRPAQEQDEGLGLVAGGHPCSFSTGQRAQGVTGDVPPWLGGAGDAVEDAPGSTGVSVWGQMVTRCTQRVAKEGVPQAELGPQHDLQKLLGWEMPASCS